MDRCQDPGSRRQSTAWKGALVAAMFAIFVLVADGCFAASIGHSASDEQGRRVHMQATAGPAREHAYNIRLLTGYVAEIGECGDFVLGPLPEGEYTGKEAWRKLIEPVCAVEERPGHAGVTELFADMRRCACNFGLPRYTPLQPVGMLVTASSLPKLADSSASPIVVIDRKQIEESGAASVPDLLRYLAQTAFHLGQGYRVSSAQYAELRGLGAEYTLVLINGRRAIGTAADLASNAFDLSVIPVSAVERIEVSADANSLSHGMDAIGGIVNIVLSDSVEPKLEMRYGAVRGGGAQSHASVRAGMKSEHSRLAVSIDTERREELLGSERDRWSNQDYRRFGAQDYRSKFASPFNVSSIDGHNLPGLSGTFAAAEPNPDTGTFDFVEGERNLTSLRGYQAIVPQGSWTTASLQGSIRAGSVTGSMELLAVRRENELQAFPSIISGYTLSASHPENPFGVPVTVDALLVGLPAQRYHVETASQRAVAAIEGKSADWAYGAFIVKTNEQAMTQVRNLARAAAVAQGLQANDPSNALSLYSTLKQVAVPADILLDAPMDWYMADSMLAQASMRGTPIRLLTGDVSLHVGAEYRREHLNFDGLEHDVGRNVTSMFVQAHVPLIDPGLKVLMGARRDYYSDVGGITKAQFGLAWQLTKSISVQASSSDSFRPPSLAELHLPRVGYPTVVFDPRRGEASPIELMTGGNPYLRPTTGHSDSISASFLLSPPWQLTLNFWRIQTRGHIAALAPNSLLAHEDIAFSGRVAREMPTREDTIAGRPGRMRWLDVSRANVGGAVTQGVDLSIDGRIDSDIGVFTPMLSVCLTDKFLYSDLPVTQIRLEDRAGVASEFGTIPSQRAVASLSYEHRSWRADVHARLISAYWDRNANTGQPMKRRVPGSAILDANVSRQIGASLRLTFGAFNVTDREPPFAYVGGSLGFDTSQGDLGGREIYGRLNTEF